MATANTIAVEVSPNTTLVDVDGVLRRAGDRLDIIEDDTAEQWLSAGWVTRIPGKNATGRTRSPARGKP